MCILPKKKKLEAMWKLNMQWDSTKLKYSPNPKYVVMILDRSFTYKEHCEKNKAQSKRLLT